MADFPNVAVTPLQPHFFGTPNLLFHEQILQGTTGTTFEILTGAWPTANLALFVPMPISMPFLAVKMMIYNGGTVSGNVDVGVYTSEGTKVVTSGTTAHTGTSTTQIFDITDTLLNPGLYYLACAFDNNTALIAHSGNLAINNARTVGIRQASSSFVLPTAVTFEALASAYVPSIHISGSTVI